MKQIKHLTKNITINSDAISTTSNMINYTINTDIDNYVYCLEIFTFMNGTSQFIDGSFIYSSTIHIPNLPDIMATNVVQESDLGLSGTEITKNFATSIIYLTNALSLNLEEWELI